MAFGMAILCGGLLYPMTANATTIDGLKNNLQDIYNQIDALESKQNLLQEEIDDLNAEILHTMTEIGLKEKAIKSTEEQISTKESEIQVKEVQIAETEAKYNAAREHELEQRESMRRSTRALYEKGTDSFIASLFQGKGFADMLNQMDYVERIYNYEKERLLEYLRIQEDATLLWEQLEMEVAQLESARKSLEEAKKQLEEDRKKMESQKSILDGMMAEKKKQSANFDAEMAKAKKEAEKAIKRIEEEEAKQNVGSSAANGNYKPSAYADIINNASGSDLGKQIAHFACQYIGNPYVYAGNSLTNGVDCSGFTQQVYKHFGYSLSRSSNSQESDGRAVSYDKMQPGDIICYPGHVALYIGGGLIVHASNSKPYPQGGIKVNNANYRQYKTVRRIID